jgi:hypothetical protein
METTKVSLAKCLKLKNRLAGLLNEVQSEVSGYNLTLQEDFGKVDVKKLKADAEELQLLLIALKTAMAKANVNLYERLITLAELKGKLSFLGGINTREQVQKRINQPDVVYVAAIKKDEIDKETREIQVRIDSIQDSVDEYNHKEVVEIPARIVEVTVT